jgi:drug/metabolite transporter (DMT)-like permease
VTHAPRAGLGWGFLGVFLFSFSVPFTRLAVDHLSPVFITSGRAVVAALLAIAFLAGRRQPIPTRGQLLRLFAIGGGVVVGFPLFTGLALQTVPASHAAVVVGLLPAATAVISVLMTKERPPVRFWVFAIAGALAVIVFTATAHGGFGALQIEDLYLLAAVVVTAYGYAHGAIVARAIGSWQTISWSLVVWMPVLLAVAIWSLVTTPPVHADLGDWSAFAYLSAVSMFFGFFAWYRGLAIGPVPTVSQVQLAQPVMSILWSALFLGEAIGPTVLLGGTVVIACAALAVRSRLNP